MALKYFALIILVLLILKSSGQSQFTISGYIKDSKNGESLIGATVYKKGSNHGVSTNEYGFYSLTLPKGEHVIFFKLIGFHPDSVVINLKENISRNFELTENTKQLNEVEVLGEKEDRNVKSVEMGTTRMDIKQINKIPALLGEVDIIKAIQLLPGVTSVGEGASGFNVRGGNIDQNLILLDEAPVYNSSHLFGFFSVFNPDAVKDVRLIKGGIPAQYGGRVSSILDIRMKEGNNKKLEVNGGIGTIFSRLSIEAPIIKNKASFIIAGRRSYLDALIAPFVDTKPDFYYYDLTAKFNYKINEKNTIFVSGYFGRDNIGAISFKFNWGNLTSTVRWNHVFSNKLFMNLTCFYSNYNYNLNFAEDLSNLKFDWNSNIINYSVKPDFTYFYNNKNTIRFGGQAITYELLPYDASVKYNKVNSQYKSDKRYGIESAIYGSDEFKLNSRITIEYGLRINMFNFIGSGKAFVFKDTLPNEPRPLKETLTYSSGENIKLYINPEPRISVNYLINEFSSLKSSYNRTTQYIQLVNNTAASSPLDVYTIATNNLKPLIADQISVGYFRNFKENMFETSFEMYFKYMQNQLDYIDNANLFLNSTMESELLQGSARAYGAEFYVKKAKGIVNGFLSYTLSKTERLSNGISNDNWYLSKYDRTHCLNINVNVDLGKRWSLSSNFIFLSGTPSTFPNTKLQIQNLNIPYNTDNIRNNYRIPAYHRLDLSATYNFKKNDSRRFKHYLVISLYNVYSQQNVYSIYFRTNENEPLKTEAVQVSILGSIIPAIAYNFKF